MSYLVAKRGDIFRRTIVWQNYNDNVINLTDYTVALFVEVNGVEEMYAEGDGLTLTEASGQIAIEIDSAVTADWGTSGRWWMVAVHDDDNTTVTIDHGILRVE